MIGIAFQGGGIKGSYEVGAYFAIKDCKIKIDGFCGTSIGAFNAAVLASGNDNELIEMWTNVKPAEVLGFDPKLANGIDSEKNKIELIGGTIKSVAKIIKNRGIDITPLKKHLDLIVDEEALRNSSIDFGIVTVKYKKLEPLMLFKEDIPLGKLKESVLASCYLPIFKKEQIIDGHKYLDGGFYDNCPVNMLIDKGYKKIYAIKDNGIGLNRKVKENNAEIIYIQPSRAICSFFELNQRKIRENITLGYFDAMRVLKKFDGYRFSFKPKKERYFNRITRKITLKELNRLKTFFKVKTTKEVVIKSLEYLMEKNNIDYYQVYRIPKMIKSMKTIKIDKFVYDFIEKLK